MTLSPTVERADGEADSLVARLAGEMNRRWHQGERPLVEEFLGRYPELRDQPADAVELIYEEICLRQELDKEIPSKEVLARFPHWQGQLRALLDCHHALEPGSTTPHFPEAGDWLGDSQLLAELGRGAQGRVFLAKQPALADRAVVLKVVPLGSQEHLSLARLQHTHIVPVYSVQDYPGRNLRALCMPYFGGTTLDRVLAALRPHAPGKRKGRRIVEVLAAVQGAAPVPLPVQGSACQVLSNATYADAICWVGECLAEALQYAHEHGLLHLDLKPSNVLLGADGQPLLLDFHLAQAPLPAGGPPPLWLGGTPGYMAPEHQAALAAVREGQPLKAAVEARADIYSLGVLLYEALGGRLPIPASSPGKVLRRANPNVRPGLADLIARCLALRPEERYRDAGALAADLRRQREHHLLRGVANRSWLERWRKWRRRSPQALPLLSVLLALSLGSVLLLEWGWVRISEAEPELEQGTEDLHKERYQEAARKLERGLDLIDLVPFTADLRERLTDHLRWAKQGEVADQLHQLAEQTRTLGVAADLPSDQLRSAEAHCRIFWYLRHKIILRLGLGQTPQLRHRVRTDLLDLAILWTGLRVRLAEPEAGPAREEALVVLAQAEELFGSSQALCLERLAHAEKLGLADLAQQARRQAEALPPRTAWEHFALGRALFQAGRLEDAADHLDRSLELQEKSLWAHFYRGKCHYQRGNFAAALASFNVCVVLAPNQPWCYYNRGLAEDKLGQTATAAKSLTRALELDPTHREARALLDRLTRQP